MLKCYNYDIVCQEIPDEVTLALNISGCPNHCQGCHSPWLWEDSGEALTDDAILAIVGNYTDEITCVCFMGGDQAPTEVERLAQLIRKTYPELSIAWYSGLNKVSPDISSVTSFDYIKTGPYIAALGGLKSPTTNQRLYHYSPDGTATLIKLK